MRRNWKEHYDDRDREDQWSKNWSALPLEVVAPVHDALDRLHIEDPDHREWILKQGLDKARRLIGRLESGETTFITKGKPPRRQFYEIQINEEV